MKSEYAPAEEPGIASEEDVARLVNALYSTIDFLPATPPGSTSCA